MKTLITHGYVITVDKDFTILHDGAVCYENDRILDIGDTAALIAKYPDATQIDAAGMVVMPGLINTHMHSCLIRGTVEDLTLWDWLTLHADPMHKALQEDEAYIASKLCYSESLLAGTTTLVDMYRYMHRCADSAKETGIRAILVPYVGDQVGYEYFESVDTNERLFLDRNGDADGRISVWFGIEHTAYVKKESFKRIAKLAEKYDTGIHTHGDETMEMYLKIQKQYGCPPTQEFHNKGILGPKTLLAHCCWITPFEIDLLAKTGTSIAHCPVCNAKLACGVCPVPAALDAGVAVGLATDGIKENNNLDMLEEMKVAAILQKLHNMNPQVLPAPEVIKMATIYGARAISMQDEIGSLEVGKKADIILIDFRKLHLSPMLYGKYENVVPNIVFSAGGADVDTVIVNGVTRVKGHKLLSANTDELMAMYQTATEKLLVRREPLIPKVGGIDTVEV